MNRTLLFLSAGVVGLMGCGGSDLPELGEVTGTVTLDGEPLPNAIVHFNPQGEGRPSTGETDENGRYTLQYTVDAPGAMVGTHTVRVVPLIDSEEMDNYDEEHPELGGEPPPVYPQTAGDGSIVKDVVAGSNEIDIEIVSSE